MVVSSWASSGDPRPGHPRGVLPSCPHLISGRPSVSRSPRLPIGSRLTLAKVKGQRLALWVQPGCRLSGPSGARPTLPTQT